MKKLFVCVLMLVISVHICAQTIDKDDVDDFDGSRVIATGTEDVGKNQYLGVKFSAIVIRDKNNKFDTAYTAFLFFKSAGITSVTSASKIYIKYNDGSIETFNNLGTTKVLSNNDLGSVYFDVRKFDLKTINAKEIERIRISTTNYNVDVTLVDGTQSVLQKHVEVVKGRLKIKP
jgi:hypothetical protein